MDPQFWHERWQRADIGFHQKATNDLLVKHWPGLCLPAGSRVFVPLCGKSLDMVWLAAQGHEVIGNELSELAVDSFFADLSRRPGEEHIEPFKLKRAGPYELWCGDFFAMPEAATRRIRAVYDRAALVAMPRVLQPRYAAKLAALTPAGVPVMLVALDYDPSAMEGPPFPVGREEVNMLFGRDFRVQLAEAREGIARSDHLRKRGLKHVEEAVYLLERR
jgi:thiopurine S-methyltransferase